MAEAIAGQSRHSVLAYKALYRAQADLPLDAGLAMKSPTAPASAPISPRGSRAIRVTIGADKVTTR